MSGAAAGYWVAGRADFAFSKSPNERLSIAGIGVGGKGKSDIDQAGKFGDVVAICDIDDVRLDEKAQLFPKAKKYNDYRKLLDEMGASWMRSSSARPTIIMRRPRSARCGWASTCIAKSRSRTRPPKRG